MADNTKANTPTAGKDGSHERISTIHTERYTQWNGNLLGRQAIIGHTVYQGFKHMLSNKWVKILVILIWIFNVFIPLLLGYFGINSLVQSPDDANIDDDDAYDLILTYDVAFPLSETIEEGEVAAYNITVMNSGEKTDVIDVWISYVDDGWFAGMFPGSSFDVGNDTDNTEGEEKEAEYRMNFTLAAGEIATFMLVVMPPEGVVSGKGVVMLETESQGAIRASSGLWEDDFIEVKSEIYAITLVGHSEGSPYHFIMTTDSKSITNRTVKAGDEISFPVTITNTGIEDERFIIRVDGVPSKWKYHFEGLDDPSQNLTGSITEDEVGVYLQPGENRTFTVFYDTPKYPGSSTFIGVAAYSVNDHSLSGGVITIVEATDIPDQDMTSEVIEGLFAEVLMLFALFLAAVAGSRAISEDVAQKSFTIYFSRPIKKLDYVAIKFGSVGAVMCFGTMVPVLVTYAGLIALSSVGSDYIIDHLWVWGAIILHSLLIVTVLTSLSLAFSSITARRFYAAFGLVVSYMISAIVSAIMIDDFNEERGSAISIYYSIQQVGAKIFDVPNITYDYAWTYNLLALMTIVVICISVVIMKVWKTELSE